MRTLLGLICVLLALAGCETVNVDSSSSGNQSLSALKTFYITPDFPVTDGSKPPSAKFTEDVQKGIAEALTSKGYTAAGSADQADFVLQGSWELGKVMGNNLPTSVQAEQRANTGYAEYLTLNAVRNGDTLWSVNSPITGKTMTDALATVLTAFPPQGGS